MSDPKHLIIGGMCLPLDIEALEALPINPGGVFQFDFTFHDIRFAIRYEEAEEHGALRIVGDVGPMPFSAESPVARAGLNQIMRRANDVLSPSFRVALGRMVLGTEMAIERPVTATKLIATVAAQLIPATPYLDLIALYIRPPMAPAKKGDAALRPEWRKKALPAATRR
ncbi:hypothetical protein [Magnetospirillum sulfuroxidans]|uniref:Uncharacterized protein n=1 Tax=Magnetospirillum sulfuroxidans TaxID=611300 RepID=A0ABS5IA12_9PROT|nr:hypothetical protein [Magnetospirillum sulfuroxidans]MBR9971257.1 hypothetical protein [Magnetospirillum sulfuroxidans]